MRKKGGSIPLRRNIRVAEAWDRMCPPIGLRAPPATKVIVAPGSARRVSVFGTNDYNEALALDLICEKYSNLSKDKVQPSELSIAHNREQTLYSSESLVILESI